MSWRERIGAPAKFRGVEFFVDVAELAGGRRTVTHEFPLRDRPFVEDLGRRARAFPVEGYVLGDDYLVQRDALIAALEESGPGELVHPYYGTRRLAVLDFHVQERRTEGGIARFSIEFGETETEPAFPSAVPAGADRVATSASAVRESVGKEFLALYQPGTLTASAADALRAATLSIDNARATISMATEEAAALRRRLDRLTSTAAALVNAPTDVLAELADLFVGLPGVDALIGVYGFAPGLRPPATTTTRVQEQVNFDALVGLVRTLALVRAAELAPSETYDSYDAALATRDSIVDKLDERSESSGDETYAALDQLRADLVRAVPGEERDLPRLVRYTPPATVPSLVLAHQLYGDVAREADIVTRNRVLRPGFIVGGREIEVLGA